MTTPLPEHPAEHSAPPSLGPWWVIALGTAPVTALLGLGFATASYVAMATHGHAFSRILLLYLGSWSFWSLVAPTVVGMGYRHVTGRGHLLAAAGRAIPIAIGLALLHSTVAAVLLVWIQPHREMVTYGPLPPVGELFPGMLPIDLLLFIMLWVAGASIGAYRRTRQLELRELRLEAELARAQLNALQLEIRPHFLFNTLNSIAALIRTQDNAAALTMLLTLSDLMRSTLERSPDQLATLDQEIEFTSRYVSLQRTRFGDRLTVDFAVDPGARQRRVPVFLFQTLVENAIRHGAAPQLGPCRIEIGACEDAGHLRLWVDDDGRGLPAGFDPIRDAGTGLTNTRSRLRQLYGEAATLTLERRPSAGTSVSVVLPLEALPAGGPA